jgi:hypothetical protein
LRLGIAEKKPVLASLRLALFRNMANTQNHTPFLFFLCYIQLLKVTLVAPTNNIDLLLPLH